MTVSFTATPDNTLGTITLEITGGTADDTIVSLLRSDANGTNPVRLFDGQDLSGGALTVVDAEASLTGVVSYNVRAMNQYTGLGSLWSETASTAFSEPLAPWLVPVTRPNLSMRLEAILEYSSSRETGSTIHDIINRADPVVVFGEHKLRKGSMEIFANSYADLLEIEAVVGTGQTLLLRQTENAGMDMYFYGVRTEQMVLFRPSDPSKWSLLVEFVETAYPYDYLLGTYGWTIADALARNATILEELTEFPLILDGVEGP